jgi:hypothetical protein
MGKEEDKRWMISVAYDMDHVHDNAIFFKRKRRKCL